MIEDALDALFRQPPLIQLAVFVVNGLIAFGAGLAFIRWFQRYPKPELWTPVSTFHAAGIWANKSHAEHTHIESGTAIKRLDDLLGPQQLNLPGPREALHRYVRHVLKDEWRKTTNYSSAPEAEQAFLELHVRTMAAIKDLPPAIAGQLFALLNEAARARSERLW